MTQACVVNSVANFDHVLATRKLGREQKKERGPRGRGEKETLAFLLSRATPSFLFFCSCPNFRAAKTLKFATETLATQAKMTLTQT